MSGAQGDRIKAFAEPTAPTAMPPRPGLPLSHEIVLSMQRTAGNRAVSRFLGRTIKHAGEDGAEVAKLEDVKSILAEDKDQEASEWLAGDCEAANWPVDDLIRHVLADTTIVVTIPRGTSGPKELANRLGAWAKQHPLEKGAPPPTPTTESIPPMTWLMASAPAVLYFERDEVSVVVTLSKSSAVAPTTTAGQSSGLTREDAKVPTGPSHVARLSCPAAGVEAEVPARIAAFPIQQGGVRLDSTEKLDPVDDTLWVSEPTQQRDATVLVGCLTYAYDLARRRHRKRIGADSTPAKASLQAGARPTSLHDLFGARLGQQKKPNAVGPRPEDREEGTAESRASQVVAVLKQTNFGPALKERLDELKQRRTGAKKMSPREAAGPGWRLTDRIEIDRGIDQPTREQMTERLNTIWDRIRVMVEPQVLAIVPPCTVLLTPHIKNGRAAEYDSSFARMSVQPNSLDFMLPFVTHEFTHHLEYCLPNSIWAGTVAFLRDRSTPAGETEPRPLRPPSPSTSHTEAEYDVPPEQNPVGDPYALIWGDDGGTELLTRAVEVIYKGDEGLATIANDPAFLVLLLRALRPAMAAEIAADARVDLAIPASMLGPG